MANVVGVVRLSKQTDESTSRERQKARIERWADEEGHTIVGWATDIDVSGTVDPWERPSLGPWLARPEEYDILACATLDRIARRVFHLSRMLEWGKANNVAIKATSGDIDPSSKFGWFLALLVAFIAEGELEAISERQRSSRAKIRGEDAKWHGGQEPYGLQKVKVGQRWAFEHSSDAPRVRQIVAWVLDGKSLKWIAGQANALGWLSPKDAQRVRNGKWHPPMKLSPWYTTTVLVILRSHNLLGHVMYKGQIVRDENGMPKLIAPPLVTMDEWNRIQAALETGYAKHSTHDASPLQRCVKCARCNGGYNLNRSRPQRRYWYYRCVQSSNTGIPCDNKTLKADYLEEWVNDCLLSRLGDTPLVRTVHHPAEDHTEELQMVLKAMSDVQDDRERGYYEGREDKYHETMNRLSARRKALAALPSRPAWTEEIRTGQTFREHWLALTPDARRDFMIEAGVSFTVDATGGAPRITANLGDLGALAQRAQMAGA